MDSTESSTGSQQPNLPPGFRFHPTDEELVVHYLKKKASSAPLPVAIIAEVDLYKFDPWELPAKAAFGEQEWYFFSPRDRKYPNGARPNRAATSGYWKATGTDKPVLTSNGNQKVGVKKALVFYGGKPPRGIKTNWIMHEYRLADNKPNNKPPGCNLGNKKNSLRVNHPSPSNISSASSLSISEIIKPQTASKLIGSDLAISDRTMPDFTRQLDDWVLCRIYKKSNTHRSPMDHDDLSMHDIIGGVPPSINVGQMNARFHLSKMSTTYGGVTAGVGGGGSLLLDTNTDHSLLEGVVATTANNGINTELPSLVSSNLNTSVTTLPSKRTLPSLYRSQDEDFAGTSSKRLSFDNDENGVCSGGGGAGVTTAGASSIASLLNQLPQTPSMVGSLGDGMLRAQYEIPGMHWYA